MSQNSGRPCPACGTSVPAGQRFCSNCGTDMNVSGQPGQQGQYGSSPQQGLPPTQQTPQYGGYGQQQQQQVPPYAQAPGSYGQVPQYQQPQRSNPIAEALGALGLLFFLRRYRPGYQARRQSSGCCGCLVSLVILLAIFGTPAFLYFRANPNAWNQLKAKIQNSSNNGANNGGTSAPGTTPTIGITPITTTFTNQTVTYAGVDITIQSVVQATSFSDDGSAGSNGVMRINIKEVNGGKNNASYFYSDIAHLILSDNSSVALANALQSIGPNSSVTRDNWLDFAMPTSAKVNQMKLVLGSAKDAQITIPLTGHANLSAFQARTVNPNKPINYAKMNWTLKSATQGLSIDGKQAATGMVYVVLTFNIDNPSSGDVVTGFTDSYMRLKSADSTNPSVDNTLPLTVKANTNGATGTVTFLMPANSTAYTLIFLAQQGLSNTPVNTDFTIQ